MRLKEDADDYRYIPDPDLAPMKIDPAHVEEIRENMPEPAHLKTARFVEEYGIDEADAKVLTSELELADAFENIPEIERSNENAVASGCDLIVGQISSFGENAWGTFEQLEEEGIISPVVGVSCKYKTSTTFSDTVYVTVRVEHYTGVKLTLSYIMTNAEGKAVCSGTSEHCFVNAEGRIIQVKKDYPAFHAVLTELAEQ